MNLLNLLEEYAKLVRNYKALESYHRLLEKDMASMDRRIQELQSRIEGRKSHGADHRTSEQAPTPAQRVD